MSQQSHTSFKGLSRSDTAKVAPIDEDHEASYDLNGTLSDLQALLASTAPRETLSSALAEDGKLTQSPTMGYKSPRFFMSAQPSISPRSSVEGLPGAQTASPSVSSEAEGGTRTSTPAGGDSTHASHFPSHRADTGLQLLGPSQSPDDPLTTPGAQTSPEPVRASPLAMLLSHPRKGSTMSMNGGVRSIASVPSTSGPHSPGAR